MEGARCQIIVALQRVKLKCIQKMLSPPFQFIFSPSFPTDTDANRLLTCSIQGYMMALLAFSPKLQTLKVKSDLLNSSLAATEKHRLHIGGVHTLSGFPLKVSLLDLFSFHQPLKQMHGLLTAKSASVSPAS